MKHILLLVITLSVFVKVYSQSFEIETIQKFKIKRIKSYDSIGLNEIREYDISGKLKRFVYKNNSKSSNVQVINGKTFKNTTIDTSLVQLGYRYNDDGTLKEKYTINNGVETDFSFLNYNSAGLLITDSTIGEGRFMPKVNRYEYDDIGNRVKTSLTSGKNSGRQIYQSYNDKGLSVECYIVWNKDDTVFIHYNYNDNDLKVEEVQSMRKGKESKIIFEYDEHGNLLGEKRYSYDGELMSIKTYQYNESGLLKKYNFKSSKIKVFEKDISYKYEFWN